MSYNFNIQIILEFIPLLFLKPNIYERVKFLNIQNNYNIKIKIFIFHPSPEIFNLFSNLFK